MDHGAARFVLVVTVAVLAAATVVAEQAPPATGPDLQRNAADEEGAVKRVDAAIFIVMNQVGAQPVAKGVEIRRHLP